MYHHDKDLISGSDYLPNMYLS